MKTFWKFALVCAILLIASAGWAAPAVTPPHAAITEPGIDLAARPHDANNGSHQRAPLDNVWTVPGDFSSIQAAVNGSSPGDVINVLAGNYYENVVVAVSVTINGAGQGSTFVYPALSAPGDSLNGSLQAGTSHVFLIQANDVTISNLTIDGDNPGLVSGVGCGGADIDARNGIIQNHAVGVYNNTVVHHVTVRNVYLRAIYMSSGGSGFNIHHNTVQNVQCVYAGSIGIFNYGGAGSITDNNVSDCNDAISANWSRGTNFVNNIVTNSGSGVHTDNNGGFGGVADLIDGNQVSNGPASSYGVFIFFPYLNAVANNNTVTNCDYGLFAWGGSGGTGQFTNNSVNCSNRAGSLGIYVTPGPDYWGSWQDNVTTNFATNSVQNCAYGFGIETDDAAPLYTATVTNSGLTQTGNTNDIYVKGLGTITTTGLGGHTVFVDYPGNLQLGLNLATGSIVTVAPGTYAPITISTPIDLRGAQYGVDARGRVASESIITAGSGDLVLLISGCAGASIDGFTLSGGSRGIESSSGPLNNLQIKNNRIIGFTGSGVFLNDPGTDISVDKNVVDGSSQVGNGDVFHLDTDGFNGFWLTNNNIVHGIATGFFVDGNHNIGMSGRAPLISGNLFGNNVTGANLGSRAFGSGTITLNTFTASGFDGLQGGIQNSTITRNNFTSNGRSGLALTSFGNTGADRGAQFSTVTENFFSGNVSEDLKFSSTQAAGTISTNSATNNSFASATGAAYAGTETINCSGNWWGSNVAATVTSHINSPGNKIDYTPWLDVSTDTDLGTAGFQGSHSTLWVDDDSPQTGVTARIQEGINSVSGSIVNIMPGTYNENDVVNIAALTLNGAGSGSNPASNSIINGGGGIGILLNAGGTSAVLRTVIQNLRVTGCSNALDIDAPNASYLTLNNIAFVSNTGHGINTNPPVGFANFADFILMNCDLSSNGQAGFRTATYVGINGLAITGGGMNGNTYGFYTNSAVGSPLVTNVNVNGTTFNNNSSKGMYCENLDNATFTGITVNSSGTVGANGAGIDINLKYHSFANIIFVNPTVTNSGTGDAVNGAGLTIKARDDAPSYNTNPATLNNVQVTGGTFSGNQEAFRFGEPAKNNAGPTGVVVNGNSITGSTLKEMRNVSLALTNAECNWWGSLSYPFVASRISGPVDFTPYNNATLTSCTYTASTAFVLADPYIGCTCNLDTLFLTTTAIGLPNLEMIIQLPAGFDLDFPAVPPAHGGMPAYNADPNLTGGSVLIPNELPSDQVEVSIDWNGSGSTGNPAYYVAAIPIKNVSGAAGPNVISGVSNDWVDVNGNHVNTLTMDPITINVDCAAPTITTFTNTASCAFGSAAQVANMFSATLDNGGGSPLDSAWVTFSPGGGSFALFGPNPGSNPYSFTFPAAGAPATTFYGYLANNGCNDLTLHLKDTECNVTTMTLTNIGRDETPPTLGGVPVALGCYGPNTYLTLDNNLDITADLSGSCAASTGTLKIWYDSDPDTLFVTLPLANANWPFNDTDAGTFWTWMTTLSGVPGTANGETYTFNVKACDCAGNCSASSFTMCIDLTAPTNTVSTFDARPADAGVWLKWNWTASAQADCMQVYRSPMTGSYPANTSSNWTLSAGNYPTTTYPPAGWELVATQTGSTSSLNYSGQNGHGNNDHAGVDSSYWLDADTNWVSGAASATYRDVYKYVTFTRDNGGNWSTSTAAALLTNADRATNYWLGDFVTSDVSGLASSKGHVDTEDLDVLSTYYFTAAGNFTNVGPVVVENGSVGKGIPNPPDNNINFQDFVVFGFNYGEVSRVNESPKEFKIDLPPTTPTFNQLDAAPVVSLARTNDALLEPGTEFDVAVTVSGNSANVLKGVETELTFDRNVIDFVSATAGQFSVTDDGVLFSKASAIGGTDNKVGLVAGACGGTSTLVGDGTLGTVTFRWKSDHAAQAHITLSAVRMADGSGATTEGTGSTLTIGATGVIPTSYALYQNYPNPFNPSTTIHYDLKEAGTVTIRVFNVLGENVATLMNGEMPAGQHVLTFDASKLSSGLYVYTIQVNGFTDHKKMLLMK